MSPPKKPPQPELPEGRPTLLLVDGPSQMFRAFFAIRRLSTRQGMPTGAIYGFTTMLRKVLRDYEPDYIAVAFDTPEPTFRHEIYEEYKGNREETPDDLLPQIPHVKRVCDVLEVPLLVEKAAELGAGIVINPVNLPTASSDARILSAPGAEPIESAFDPEQVDSVYDRIRRPVELVQTSYRGDVYKYVVRLKRTKGKRGHVWVHQAE